MTNQLPSPNAEGRLPYWFNWSQGDGKSMHVRLTRGLKTEVTNVDITALFVLFGACPEAISALLGDPSFSRTAGNPMLSIASPGEYTAGKSGYGSMKQENTVVYFAGKDITTKNGEIGDFVSKIQALFRPRK
jgi:hypothetical protein